MEGQLGISEAAEQNNMLNRTRMIHRHHEVYGILGPPLLGGPKTSMHRPEKVTKDMLYNL